MSVTIDARGMNCPGPVIETKKILESIQGESVLAIVDNEAAKENVEKLAKSMAMDVNVKEQGGDFYIEIFKSQLHAQASTVKKVTAETVILIGRDVMGEGVRELGKILIKGFCYALTEYRPYPKAVIFVNQGVHLTTEGSEVIDYLKQLECEGVEILSCGTCLDYYHLKSELMVGGVSNMYTIVEKLSSARNTIVL